MASFVVVRLCRVHARAGLMIAALALVAAALAGPRAGGSTINSSSAGGTPTPPLSAAAAGGALAAPGLSPQLARLAVTDPSRPVEVIIQLVRGADPFRARALVRSLGGQPGRDLHIIDGLSAHLTASAARRLAASPLVRAVSPNATVQKSTLVTFDPSKIATVFNQSIHATNIWNHATGKGVGVAVIDTGITGNLPDFQTSQGSSVSRVIASGVVDSNSATTAGDSYGHGTEVAGLVAGNGGYRDSGDALWGKYAGTAPDANLISIKIGDDNGNATTLDAIYALQFAVDHKDDYNIRVVNLSFRSTSAQSYQTDPLDAAAEQAWLDGIVVVAAAGNLGTAPDAVSYAPGNDPYVITVGAVDDLGTKSTSDDAATSWSSRGLTQDGISKPDVLAPGAHIASTLAPSSAFATLCPTCVVGGSYFKASGTSIAAPIVSGVAADLLAAYPNWTPNMVKGAIVNTASAVSGGAEVNAGAAYAATGTQLVSNRSLAPNNLIDPSTGMINPTLASWSLGSWSTATDPLLASWSLASWSCSGCTPSDGGSVNPTLASWSIGWATMWG
jgi:serine protease AprX